MEAAADSPGTAPALPGHVLADAREHQGLSRAEVAQRLHMSAYQVEALETGDYTRLPTGTFLRGFVRNYAKLVGVDPEPLLARLAEASPTRPAPGIVVPSQNIRFDPLGQRLASPYVKATVLAVVFLSLGFAALYWWFFIKPQPPAVAARKPAAQEAGGPPQQIAAAPQPAPQPVTIAPAPTEPKPATEPDLPAKPGAAPGVQPAPVAEAPKAAPVAEKKPANPRDRTVRFRFKGQSWVEVRDAADKVLLSQLNAPGSETEVTGRAPFKVVVGNAPEVEMTVNDRDFPLEPHTKVAVARFTVE